ncbi:MAG TPA: family 1 glycosylhydrolase [Steroidobacteraceae bacterium]|nr:family 1 glycosylhydrolase [Steroidobacteraceae bacterium]
MHVTRDTLDSLLEPSTFQWLAGIEDTFITAPSARTGRTLDEYELTGHYERMDEDLALFAELGLRAVRYGIPWHRINPRRGEWDFGWADRPLERLLDLGIAPVVDLVHYGLPGWIDGAYLHPDYPEYVAEFASRIAERYRGRIHTYTPLNEPRVTAWYCGRLGWWPPFGRSWRGFVQVMMGVCRGVVRTVEALRAVDPQIVDVHVDATDLYEAVSAELTHEAARRQEIVFLALDLVSGRVRPGHSLFDWLLENGASAADLDWFATRAVQPDLIGINLYPLFSEKRLVSSKRGLRVRMRYASANIVDRLADLYWSRYRRPLLISETASEGSVARRQAWLEQSVRATARVRGRGVPLVGYTWWPLFALVTWGYREGRKPAHDYLRQMGLWDLRADDEGRLARVPTVLVDRYRELVAGGAGAVGRLGEAVADAHGGARVS